MSSPFNTKWMLVFATIFMIHLESITEVNAEIVVPITNDHVECSGSLLVITKRKAEKRFADSNDTTLFKASSLQVEGCGCFYLYKNKNFGGYSKVITHHMGNMTGDYIKFLVKSVEKFDCEAYYAQPAWVVVCIVLAIILLVAVIAIIMIRCCRKFNQVPSEDNMMP